MKVSRIFTFMVFGILAMTIAASAQFTARLDWQDNSNNEDFFLVQRSLNGAPFVDLASSFLPFYDDTTLVAGPINNVYTYRVAAENAAGRSAYTNEASKTILAQAIPPPPPTALWTFCASENNQCNFTGTKEVRYGANGIYVSLILSNGVLCANSVFGDPVFGTGKSCEYRDTTALPPPPPPPSPPPATPPAPGATLTVTCSFVLTATPPDATGGWTAQFLNGTSNIGTSDSSSPYSRTVSVGVGSHLFAARWTKSGQISRTSAALAKTCP